ncbi:MAG: hypothetical protein C5B59_06360 [Bacteroidetes bacterium]|nr:MAG: hypothetical protein C5B59_06360 [Bacteroidota bacterium]
MKKTRTFIHPTGVVAPAGGIVSNFSSTSFAPTPVDNINLPVPKLLLACNVDFKKIAVKKRKLSKTRLILSTVFKPFAYKSAYIPANHFFNQYGYWLHLLYAPGHTLIYYPSHLSNSCPVKNGYKISLFINHIKPKNFICYE